MLGTMSEKRAARHNAAAVKTEGHDLVAPRSIATAKAEALRIIRDKVWEQIPEDLRNEAYQAADNILDLQKAIEAAQAQLNDHEKNWPTRARSSKAGTIEGWAARKSELETQIAVFGRQLVAAEAQYSQIDAKLVEIALVKAKSLFVAAETNVKVAKLERAVLEQQALDVYRTACQGRAAAAEMLNGLRMNGGAALYGTLPPK